VGGGGATVIVVLLVMLLTSGGDSGTAAVEAEPATQTASMDAVTPDAGAGLTDQGVGTDPSSFADTTQPDSELNPAAALAATTMPDGNSIATPGAIASALNTTSNSSTPIAASVPSGGLPTGVNGSTPVKGSEAATSKPTVQRRTEPFANLADLIEAIEPSVVRVNVSSREGTGNGSGYVIDREGTIITNRHVIEGAAKVTGVFQGDDTEYPVTGYYLIDEKRDIAILKLDCPVEKLHPIVITDELPRKGESLIAFGAPLGLDFTASEGILSAIRESSDLAKMGISGHEGVWMQHTVPISPGNSGGPLVNMKGELIGMNTMQITIGQNLNFAISSPDIKDALAKRATLQPLRPETVPVLVRAGEADPSLDVELTDVVGTEKADELLGQIKTAQVIMLALGFDPTRRVTLTVRSDLEDAISKASVRTSSRAEVRVFVGMRVNSVGGNGTQAVTITTMVHYLDLNGDHPVIYKIWDEEEKAGTVAGLAFVQGVVPDNLRKGIKSHFRKLSGAINRNRLAAEREKK
jgi:S1-C subfamily serine protease